MIPPRKLLGIIPFLVLALVSSSASANPIAVEMSYYGNTPVDAVQTVPLTLGVSAGALLFEFLLLQLLFRNASGLSSNEFAGAFVKIHLLTFPLTQVFGMMAGFLAEIIPITGEYLYYKRSFEGRLTPGRIMLGSFAGNLGSYLAGVAAFQFLVQKSF